MFISVIDEVSKIIIPEKPEEYYNFLQSQSQQTEADVILENLLDLYLVGESKVSQVCGAIISKSMSNKSAEDRNKNRQDTMNMSMSIRIKGGRSLSGKYKFCSLRSLFSKVIIGKIVPERSYSYRVKPERITTGIQFL